MGKREIAEQQQAAAQALDPMNATDITAALPAPNPATLAPQPKQRKPGKVLAEQFGRAMRANCIYVGKNDEVKLARNINLWAEGGITEAEITAMVERYSADRGMRSTGYPAWRDFQAKRDKLLAAVRRTDSTALTTNDRDNWDWNVPELDDTKWNWE